MSDQPALFLPLMSLVSNALSEERELAEAEKKRKDDLVQRTQARAGKGGKPGPVSVLNSGGRGYAPIPTPGKKG